MSGNSWDKLRTAKEEEFFVQRNKEAMERLSLRKIEKPRPCPVDGSLMKQVTLMGVNIDQCESCQGVWLDGGELDVLLKESADTEASKGGWLEGLFGALKVK